MSKEQCNDMKTDYDYIQTIVQLCKEYNSKKELCNY